MTMTETRLWGYGRAFDEPATLWFVMGILAAFALAATMIGILSITGRASPALRTELWKRTFSWSILAPVLGLPVLAGAAWTVAAILLVSLFCYREYARATGLFRERVVSAFVVVGILAIYFAVIDHWYGFFFALVPLGVVALAVVSIPLDRPEGYIQRVGLAVFAFLLFGSALAHLACMANDGGYRPVILMILVCVSLSDVSAFTFGKLLGGPKLLPATSPNKTISGALSAFLVTAALVTVLSGWVFLGGPMAGLGHRIGLEIIVGALAQLGDLMLSSIKRDLGIKDMGTAIPGHGGVLGRFNSLLLVAPATFHYVGYFKGFGLSQQVRIITGR
jgi:phosphatidate cytidylyltransferase